MKRTLILASLLLATALTGEPVQASNPDTCEPRAQTPVLEGAVQSQALFYRLSSGIAERGGVEVRFEVHDNGDLYIQEHLRVAPVAGEPAVELLAYQPDILKGLYELVRDGHLIEVSVFAGGSLLEKFPFEAFLVYNEQVKSEQFRPHRAASTLDGPAARQDFDLSRLLKKAAATGSSCVDQCYSDYDYCIYENCQPYVYNYWCSLCDDFRDQCIQNCGCQDPKSVTYSTSSQIISSFYTGYSQCFVDWFASDPNWGYWYNEKQYTIKRTKTKRTEYCDGSVTTEVVQVWYEYPTCFERSYSSCYTPWQHQHPYNVC